MNIFSDLFQKIAVTITSVFIATTSFLPGATSNANKPIETFIASPSATISMTPTPTLTTSPAAAIKPTLKPRPKLSPSPSPTPSRVSVLLVSDGATVYCLNEWADEVKRASQSVKDAEELLNKFKDCNNSCSTAYEMGAKDCLIKYPKLSENLYTSGYMDCGKKVQTERTSCRNNCPHSSSDDPIEIGVNLFKSKKFLQETKGEHCIDSK